MSKRTRHADNSKRQQPTQQQRAQAHQPGNAANRKARPQRDANADRDADKKE